MTMVNPNWRKKIVLSVGGSAVDIESVDMNITLKYKLSATMSISDEKNPVAGIYICIRPHDR